MAKDWDSAIEGIEASPKDPVAPVEKPDPVKASPKGRVRGRALKRAAASKKSETLFGLLTLDELRDIRNRAKSYKATPVRIYTWVFENLLSNHDELKRQAEKDLIPSRACVGLLALVLSSKHNLAAFKGFFEKLTDDSDKIKKKMEDDGRKGLELVDDLLS